MSVPTTTISSWSSVRPRLRVPPSQLESMRDRCPSGTSIVPGFVLSSAGRLISREHELPPGLQLETEHPKKAGSEANHFDEGQQKSNRYNE